MNQSTSWPEDVTDWPQTASVVQGGVSPVASVVVSDRKSADLASAVRNVINKAEQKTGIRPDVVVTKHRHAASTQEPFGYFRVEPFGWVDCGENDEGAVVLYDQETVNALQGRCDELQKQRDELLAALEQFVTWGHMQHRAQSMGCHATFDMMSLKDEIDLAEAVIDSVEGW